MSFARSLYGKLALLLLLLFAVVGVLHLALTVYATRRHYEEVNQRLNRGLAANLVQEQLPLREGAIDEAALEEIFHIMMVINPQIELYLLDPEGSILGYSAPEGVVERDRVSLEPIRRFLEGEDLPILGDDPRNPSHRKIFSVAPIARPGPSVAPTAAIGGATGEDALQGYLYVVLAAEDYASAVSMLEGSYILRLSSGLMLASLAFVLAAGLVLFHLSTRRLRRVAAAMEDFRASGFRLAPPPEHDPEGAGADDEIDQISTAFREMAERITAQMEELERTDRLRRELVANVSHDLRTPLASLHGYLETLAVKQGRLSAEEEREYLAIATRQSERLGKLVSELFELAKLDASDTELALERFSLAELVQDVVQDFRLRAEERGVALSAEIENASGLVEADIRLMERALVNLVENAVRFTPDQGRVTVSVKGVEDGLRVEVRDTGPGIPAEELPFIFDRFYRTQQGRDDGGSGLGLAITKRILEVHGSSIEVESEPGRGTRLFFTMPPAGAFVTQT